MWCFNATTNMHNPIQNCRWAELWQCQNHYALNRPVVLAMDAATLTSRRCSMAQSSSSQYFVLPTVRDQRPSSLLRASDVCFLYHSANSFADRSMAKKFLWFLVGSVSDRGMYFSEAGV